MSITYFHIHINEPVYGRICICSAECVNKVNAYSGLSCDENVRYIQYRGSFSSTMSKLSRVGKSLQKQVETEKLPSIIDAVIQAGCASTGPPLGPLLGQRGIPIGKFATDFNDKTQERIPGIPTETRLHIDGKKYKMSIYSPTIEYFLKHAAGMKTGQRPFEIGTEFMGKITYKHLYEIASVKIEDEFYTIRDYTMKEMCEELAQHCWKLGIDVDRSIDPTEYDQFLLDIETKEAEFQEEKLRKEMELKKKMKLA